MNEKEREDLNEMCNWSMAHYLDGVDKGKIEGRLEGKNEGEKRRAEKIAMKLLKRGSAIEDICELTELSEYEVTGLMNHLHLV